MADGLMAEILRFARLLRSEGVPVTPGRTIDAARALELVGTSEADGLRAALRTTLVASVDAYALFDRLFDAFWLGRRTVPARVSTPSMTTIENQPQGPPVYALARVGLQGIDPGGDARLPGGGRSAGETELLTLKDFADYSSADIPRARRLVQQLVPSLATVRSRRFEIAPSGGIDLRRTVRAAHRYGGDAAVLAHRRPKVRRLRLVALCDVSGSMDIYANHLLQFCWALQQQGSGVHTFVFSTRLRDVTGALRRRRFEDSLTALSATVETWSGGTAIGACLAEFNRRWAKELVSSRTIVLIASDGWERGDPDQLAREVAALRRRARSLIWLNPLKARTGYEPLARGMAAALPHVDHFLAAESVHSLERLKHVLAHV